MLKHRLAYLYDKYRQRTCTYKELEEWFRHLQDLQSRTHIEQLIKEDWEKEYEVADEAREIDWDFMLGKILKQLAPVQGEPEIKPKTKFFNIWRLAAAAVFLLAVSTSAYFLFIKNGSENQRNARNSSQMQTDHEIVPGGDRATLTLADGRQIILDSVMDGTLAMQGGIQVIRVGGQIRYDVAAAEQQVLYNTITTPRGGQFQLELADGSKVWLNAASSLRFPTVFAGKERKVELTGEGYFEVAHNPDMPFKVMVGSMEESGKFGEVEVIGTHFNINSYQNEPSVNTTLLEGRVRYKMNNQQVYLNPGQQVVVKHGQDSIRLNYEVNLEEVVAWKNGRFSFSSADIGSIMRQVERWYDVDVVYNKRSSETFSGRLPRSENVLQLLKMLEATGNMYFEINGKQIIVN